MKKQQYAQLVTALAVLVGAIAPHTVARAQSLTKPLPATSKVAVDLAGNDYNGSYDCRGGDARVSGDNNYVTLVHCGTIFVPGSDNKLTTVGAQAVEIRGNDNVIDWSGSRKPAVSDSGSANSIAHVTNPEDD